jgi:hypothetical protein
VTIVEQGDAELVVLVPESDDTFYAEAMDAG